MKGFKHSKIILIGLLFLSSSLITFSQFTQEGPKLVGITASNSAQGYAVAISADGNTAIVGGPNENDNVGAVWIFVRSGETWSQQGPKLLALDVTGAAHEGFSVAISSDGNTVIFGGEYDNVHIGAAWVFTRSSGVWTQQGSKLIGTGAVGIGATQGTAVSLSADGNTAIIGGAEDSLNTGAAWIFTRSGGIWTQEGPKLVGTGSVGYTYQGWAVSISADGNTAIVGGYGDNGITGAVWIFTRTAGVWTQQGPKLVGSGTNGSASQGFSVSISGDGNIMAIGGNTDDNNTGAIWIFTRSNGIWTQEGSKLVGSGAAGRARQGTAVSISADGKTIANGGLNDNSNQGAVWVHKYSGGTWIQVGNKLTVTDAVGNSQQGGAVCLSGDGNTLISGGDFDNGGAGAAWVFSANALALNFINIHTQSDDGDVLLTWEVSSDEPVVYYEIQRSINGNNFNEIATQTGNQSNFYQWTDTSALPGLSFYRIKSVALSGEIKYSSVVQVFNNKSSRIAVWPNPVEGNEIHIQFRNQEQGTYIISLVDGNGKIVLSTSIRHTGGNSSYIINLPLTTIGIYNLRVINPFKIISNQRLFIDR